MEKSWMNYEFENPSNSTKISSINLPLSPKKGKIMDEY
jgi:hypothetical protein